MIAAPWPTDPREFFLQALPLRARAHASQLGARSSTGSIAVCFEAPASTFGVRLLSGGVVVEECVPADAIARLTMMTETFRLLVGRVLPAVKSGPAANLPATLPPRLLALDASRAQRLRSLRGAVALVVVDGIVNHRVLLSPGPGDPRGDAAVCTIRVALADIVELASGRLQPIQLMMSGQLVIEGDAQLVMALLGVFA
ncbi:MAG: SCP2 sterol-binding domain-containing protein [Polyangiaceae bacterium]|nr:SCP2 sterol-binding domain-containing protein [Polyangiaceae bacterium]